MNGGRWIERGGGPWLIATVVVSLVLGVTASRVGIEHDNASLNAVDAPQRQRHDAFKATFGSDEDLLLAVTHPTLLSAAGLTIVDRLTRTIATLDGVRRVWSLTTIDELVHGRAGAEPRALVAPPFDSPDTGARAREAIARNPDLLGWLISRDGRTAGIVVELDERPTDAEYRTRIIAALRDLEVGESGDGYALHLTGVPVQKHDVAVAVDQDQRRLLPLAVLVLGATLAAFLRTVAGVILPLGVAGITVVWTMGLYGATGHDLNAITSLLPPVLLVVSVVTAVHVYEGWRGQAMRAIAGPAALCALTTAQGFGSLVTSTIPGVQQFGVFAAIGTVIAFVMAFTTMPAVLARWRQPPHTVAQHGATMRFLDATSHLATSRPRLVLLTFATITAIALLGIPRVHANTDLVGFLGEHTPLRRDTAFIDAQLTGTLPFDFVITRQDGGSVLSLDGMRRLATLEDTIRALPHVTTVTSVLALVRQVHRADTGGEALALPQDATALANAIDLLDESNHDLVHRFADPGMRTLRLAVRVHAIGTMASSPLIEAILADATRVLGPEIDCVPTGALYHVVHDSTRLVAQQVTSFATAIGLVILAIGLAFRSLTFTILALIPNVMPIVWTGGIMGFAGIDLSTGTAMIASAVLGLVVDDTIYYLAHFRRVYAGDAVAAIYATNRAVGAPVTAASVSLVFGFWVGAFGSFAPTIYFSVLTGLTMITGVACDLLVLPAALVMMERRRGTPQASAGGTPSFGRFGR